MNSNQTSLPSSPVQACDTWSRRGRGIAEASACLRDFEILLQGMDERLIKASAKQKQVSPDPLATAAA